MRRILEMILKFMKDIYGRSWFLNQLYNLRDFNNNYIFNQELQGT